MDDMAEIIAEGTIAAACGHPYVFAVADEREYEDSSAEDASVRARVSWGTVRGGERSPEGNGLTWTKVWQVD